MPDSPPEGAGSRRLERRLGAWDGALLTVGSIVGTGIFLTTGDMAKALPHAGLILLVWLLGGLLTLAGALTYAELGVLFPRAGGIYHFLKEAFGPFLAFLYGWTSFVVIMSGGIAAIAVGFGTTLGAFVPAFAEGRVLAAFSAGPLSWTIEGPQAAGALSILALTALNHAGLREGALVQNVLTVAKGSAHLVLSILGLSGLGTVWGAITAPVDLSPRLLLAGMASAMVAALWTYDGWYALTLSAGEVRDPARDLPRGLVGGTAAVVELTSAGAAGRGARAGLLPSAAGAAVIDARGRRNMHAAAEPGAIRDRHRGDRAALWRVCVDARFN